jgi:type IV pilus assembly protein PilB
MSTTNRLGELLVREKLISLQQLRQAQEEQRKNGSNLGYALAKLGYISDGEITNFLSSSWWRWPIPRTSTPSTTSSS